MNTPQTWLTHSKHDLTATTFRQRWKKFNQSFGIDENLDESMRQYRIKSTLMSITLEIANNTIVDDHLNYPVSTKNMLGYAGPFRGGKHTQLEGGVRVPFIIRWPGHVTDTQTWNPLSTGYLRFVVLPE